MKRYMYVQLRCYQHRLPPPHPVTSCVMKNLLQKKESALEKSNVLLLFNGRVYRYICTIQRKLNVYFTCLSGFIRVCTQVQCINLNRIPRVYVCRKPKKKKNKIKLWWSNRWRSCASTWMEEVTTFCWPFLMLRCSMWGAQYVFLWISF